MSAFNPIRVNRRPLFQKWNNHFVDTWAECYSGIYSFSGIRSIERTLNLYSLSKRIYSRALNGKLKQKPLSSAGN